MGYKLQITDYGLQITDFIGYRLDPCKLSVILLYNTVGGYQGTMFHYCFIIIIIILLLLFSLLLLLLFYCFIIVSLLLF